MTSRNPCVLNFLNFGGLFLCWCMFTDYTEDLLKGLDCSFCNTKPTYLNFIPNHIHIIIFSKSMSTCGIRQWNLANNYFNQVFFLRNYRWSYEKGLIMLRPWYSNCNRLPWLQLSFFLFFRKKLWTSLWNWYWKS